MSQKDFVLIIVHVAQLSGRMSFTLKALFIVTRPMEVNEHGFLVQRLVKMLSYLG